MLSTEDRKGLMLKNECLVVISSALHFQNLSLGEN